jgi:chromosome segregation ATPase
MFNV